MLIDSNDVRLYQNSDNWAVEMHADLSSLALLSSSLSLLSSRCTCNLTDHFLVMVRTVAAVFHVVSRIPRLLTQETMTLSTETAQICSPVTTVWSSLHYVWRKSYLQVNIIVTNLTSFRNGFCHHAHKCLTSAQWRP